MNFIQGRYKSVIIERRVSDLLARQYYHTKGKLLVPTNNLGTGCGLQ